MVEAAYIFGVIYGWIAGLIFLFGVGVLTVDRLREMWGGRNREREDSEKARRIRLHLDELDRWCATDEKVVETSRWLRSALDHGHAPECISDFRRRVLRWDIGENAGVIVHPAESPYPTDRTRSEK